MKKKILYLFIFVLLASGFSSCEGLLNNCKVCSLNTYEDGVLVNSVSEAEYCDVELISIEATPDADLGNNLVAKWECN